MKLPRRTFLRLAAGVAARPAASRVAWAQTYPTRPLRLIVPFTPGGAPDVIARLMGERLSDRLGQPFIIENRPGAAGNIGTEVVVRAPPDRARYSITALVARRTHRKPSKARGSVKSGTVPPAPRAHIRNYPPGRRCRPHIGDEGLGSPRRRAAGSPSAARSSTKVRIAAVSARPMLRLNR